MSHGDAAAQEPLGVTVRYANMPWRATECLLAVAACLLLAGCATVKAKDVQLDAPPPDSCTPTPARQLIDDNGATYSDSPEAAAEAWARRDVGRPPTSGWSTYERQDQSLWLASDDWRVLAARNPEKGWLVVRSYRCG